MHNILVAVIASAVVVAMLSAFGTLSALANPSPTGSGMGCMNSAVASGAGTCTGGGQPGAGPQTAPLHSPSTGGSASATLCASNGSQAPGNSFNSQSAHGTGTGNQHYAGQPGTTSSLNANSPHAVSQYDISCYQQSVH